MTDTVSVIPHADVSEDQLEKICRLKMMDWGYDMDSQRRWIAEHHLPSDLHLLMMHDNTLVAYLYATELTVHFDGCAEQVLGIGNVVVHPAYRLTGLGKALMNHFQHLIAGNSGALLLCKDELTSFYSSCDWHILNAALVCLEKELDCRCMALQLPDISAVRQITFNRIF